jgi:hypothetical protein
MFGIVQKRARARAAAKAPKLHSIAARMRGRSFAGSFDVAGVSYEFIYSPAQADLTAVVAPKDGRARQRSLHSSHTPTSGAIEDVRARLTGNLTVIENRPGLPAARHSLEDVQATLISAQGGIGTAPPRKKTPADLAPVRTDLPVVESTGALSFCGVLYFKLTPIDGRSLGVAADMNALQLNVRLAPVNDAERNLQDVYSSLADAVLVRQIDRRSVGGHVDELNKLLARG